MSTATTPGEAVAHRDRVRALLAYTVESRLSRATPATGLGRVHSPWDTWWVCYRAAASATELGIDPLRTPSRCRPCLSDVATLTATSPPGHPDQLGPRPCECLHDWAVLMRRPAPDLDWPPLRTMVAMVKPGGDAAAVHHALLKAYAIIHTAELPLTPADARRLYPDAYGADYVARQDAYLTSAPIQVLVLLAAPWAATRAKQVKARIRRHLGDTDMLRNHLHMPDNPGEALCDVCHLARSDILHDLYERYDRDSAAERLACYRAVLARR